MLLLYYNTYTKVVIGYGLLISGSTSKNRLRLIFILQKKILGQICVKARFNRSAEVFDELIVVNVYDYYNVQLLNFFS